MASFELMSVHNIIIPAEDFKDTSIVNPMVSYSDSNLLVIARVDGAIAPNPKANSMPTSNGNQIGLWTLINYKNQPNKFLIQYESKPPITKSPSTLYAFTVLVEGDLSSDDSIVVEVNQDYQGSEFGTEPVRKTKIIIPDP